MDERVHMGRPHSRWPTALLAGAVIAAAGWAGAEATGAAAATGHGSGGATLLGTTSAGGTSTEPTVTFPGSTTAPTVSPTPVTATATASGAVVAVDANSFTIQTSGTAAGAIDAMTTYASTLAAEDYPYVWGGGHGRAQIASVGEPGPGHNGKRKGFDCSGAVAAVLAAGGLWPQGEGVPNDAGVIRSLLKQGLIAKGPGTGPYEVTLYDDPGVHIFMNIDGRFFGTSDGGGGGDVAGGPGWLSDGAYDALNAKVFKRYHFLPAALNDSSADMHQITFRYAGGVAGAEQVAGLSLDASVHVSYAQASDGTLNMGTVSYTGSSTTAGIVTAVVATGSQFTLRTSSGRTLTLDAIDTSLTAGLLAGESVSVTYTRQAATQQAPAELVLHSLTITAPPSTTQTTPTVTTPTATAPTTTVTTPTTASTTPTTTATSTTTARTAAGGVSGLSNAKDTGGSGF